MENDGKRKRTLPDEEEEEVSLQISLLEPKRLKSDILEFFEDDDDDSIDKISESPSTAEEEMLDSVMRSLQEEIDGDVALSRSVDVQNDIPDLRYLLGASDDELGLPPPVSEEDICEPEVVPPEIRSLPASDGADLFGCWDFEDLMSGYGLEEVGLLGVEERQEVEGFDHVVLDGIFDFTDTSVPVEFVSMGFLTHESMPSL